MTKSGNAKEMSVNHNLKSQSLMTVSVFSDLFLHVQDDTFDNSSLFSVGSQGSAYAAGFRRQSGYGAFPSSPSAIGAADNSSDDDFDDDDDLSSRWETDKSVIGGAGGGGGNKQERSRGHDVSAKHLLCQYQFHA